MLHPCSQMLYQHSVKSACDKIVLAGEALRAQRVAVGVVEDSNPIDETDGAMPLRF